MKNNEKGIKKNTVKEKINEVISTLRLGVNLIKLGIALLGLQNAEIPVQTPAIHSNSRMESTFRKKEHKETKIKTTIGSGSFEFEFHHKKTVEY